MLGNPVPLGVPAPTQKKASEKGGWDDEGERKREREKSEWIEGEREEERRGWRGGGSICTHIYNYIGGRERRGRGGREGGKEGGRERMGGKRSEREWV